MTVKIVARFIKLFYTPSVISSPTAPKADPPRPQAEKDQPNQKFSLIYIAAQPLIAGCEGRACANVQPVCRHLIGNDVANRSADHEAEQGNNGSQTCRGHKLLLADAVCGVFGLLHDAQKPLDTLIHDPRHDQIGFGLEGLVDLADRSRDLGLHAIDSVQDIVATLIEARAVMIQG